MTSEKVLEIINTVAMKHAEYCIPNTIYEFHGIEQILNFVGDVLIKYNNLDDGEDEVWKDL